MAIKLSRGEFITKTYTGTGEQEEILFDRVNVGGTVRVIGGASDVFSLQSKIVDWADAIDSYEGKIKDLTIIGRGQGIKVDIDTNISGSIKIEVQL